MTDKINVFEVEDHIWNKVAKKLDKTEKSLNSDVFLLQEWIKTQAHLPKMLDFHSLRNFLIFSKGSIEVAKQKIDNYYSVRSAAEDIFVDINPKFSYRKELDDMMYVVPYPQLTDKMCRIFYYKTKNEKLMEKYEPLDLMKKLVTLQELRLREDVMFGDVIVMDCEDIPISASFKITPTLAYKCLTMIWERIFSLRIKAIYVLNMPPYGSMTMNLFEKIFKPKIFQRIHVLPNTEALKKVIPLKLIPKEFGGEGLSLDELQDALDSKYVKNQDLFDRLDEIKVDESLRPEKLKNDDIMGFYGNFKKLDID